MTSSEHRRDRILNRSGLGLELRGVTQEHRRRCNRADRIGDVAAGEIGSGSVHRLVQIDLSADRGGRQHAKRSGECSRFVGEDVAEQDIGEDHVKSPRVGHEVHRARVDIHVLELDVRIIRCDARHDFAPQTR